MKKVIMVCAETKARYAVEVDSLKKGAVIKNVKNGLMAKIFSVEGSEVTVKSYKGKIPPSASYRVEKKTSNTFLFSKNREEYEAAWIRS